MSFQENSGKSKNGEKILVLKNIVPSADKKGENSLKKKIKKELNAILDRLMPEEESAGGLQEKKHTGEVVSSDSKEGGKIISLTERVSELKGPATEEKLETQEVPFEVSEAASGSAEEEQSPLLLVDILPGEDNQHDGSAPHADAPVLLKEAAREELSAQESALPQVEKSAPVAQSSEKPASPRGHSIRRHVHNIVSKLNQHQHISSPSQAGMVVANDVEAIQPVASPNSSASTALSAPSHDEPLTLLQPALEEEVTLLLNPEVKPLLLVDSQTSQGQEDQETPVEHAVEHAGDTYTQKQAEYMHAPKRAEEVSPSHHSSPASELSIQESSAPSVYTAELEKADAAEENGEVSWRMEALPNPNHSKHLLQSASFEPKIEEDEADAQMPETVVTVSTHPSKRLYTPYRGKVRRRVIETNLESIKKRSERRLRWEPDPKIIEAFTPLAESIQEDIRAIPQNLKQTYAKEASEPFYTSANIADLVISSRDDGRQRWLDHIPELEMSPKKVQIEHGTQSAQAFSALSAQEDLLKVEAETEEFEGAEKRQDIHLLGEGRQLDEPLLLTQQSFSDSGMAAKEALEKNVSVPLSESAKQQGIIGSIEQQVLSSPSLIANQSTVVETIASLFENIGSALNKLARGAVVHSAQDSRAADTLPPASKAPEPLPQKEEGGPASGKKNPTQTEPKSMIDSTATHAHELDQDSLEFLDHEPEEEQQPRHHPGRARPRAYDEVAQSMLKLKRAASRTGFRSYDDNSPFSDRSLDDAMNSQSHLLLESIVREAVKSAVEPMVSQWLELNLGRIVRKTVEREISIIMRQQRGE